MSFGAIILIGAARSGTKLLRDLVAQHSLIDCVPYDINFIWRYGNERVPHDELHPDSIDQKNKRRIHKAISRYHKGSPFLIEKTVSNCLRIPFVDAIYPDAKFIFLIRDGRDVVESSLRQWLAPTDWKYVIKKSFTYPIWDAPSYAFSYASNIMKKQFSRKATNLNTWGPRYDGINEDVRSKEVIEICAIQWVKSIVKSLESLDHVESQRVITVRYESLVTSPDKELLRIFDFLDLDFNSFEGGDFISSVSTERIGKGWKQFNTRQQKIVLSHIRETLDMINY